MNFSEAREALHQGTKIRHEAMPEGNYFMTYHRGFSHDMILIIDADECISGDFVDFGELFWSAMHNDDDGWEVSA